MPNVSEYTKNILNQLGSTDGRDSVSKSIRVIDGFDWRSYYSSSDVRFEFDSIPIEEVTTFSYKVVEPVKFHYGYNSYVRLAESRGSRMIHGSFSVNFRDPLQLFYLLDKIKSGQTPEALTPADLKPESDTISKTVSNIVSSGLKNRLTPGQIQREIKEYSDTLTKNSSLNKVPVDVLQKWQDTLWGKAPVATSEVYLKPKYKSKPHGFNIKIVFGEPGEANTIIPNELASYRLIGASDSSVRRQVGAIRLIRGVEIIGEGQEISPSGESIQSVYEFIAAEIN